MTRDNLEHLLRAAADITGDDEIFVMGSQAVLGQFPDAPAALRVSVEADFLPVNRPDRADLIDGTIGELSPFHSTFGYYAQGIGLETAVLPAGWRDRVIRLQNENTRGATGLCLEIHDLLIAKCIAGREKDWSFLSGAIAHGLVDRSTLLARVDAVAALTPAERTRLREAIDRRFAA